VTEETNSRPRGAWRAVLVVIASLISGCLAVVLGITWLLSSWSDGLCANSLTQTLASPDGRLKAVAFSRDCGATTDFSEQLSILPAATKHTNDGGNTFVAGRHETFAFHWTGARSLEITGSRATAFHAANEVRVLLGPFHWETVRISYRP
jgi:hypothetical protein